MGDDDFESFDNLDDLDWSDVEDELKANREQIIAEAGKSSEGPSAEISSDAFAEAVGGGGGAMPMQDGALDINFLLDVQLEISVEVGRTRMEIMHLLSLKESSIIELNTLTFHL